MCRWPSAVEKVRSGWVSLGLRLDGDDFFSGCEAKEGGKHNSLRKKEETTWFTTKELKTRRKRLQGELGG